MIVQRIDRTGVDLDYKTVETNGSTLVHLDAPHPDDDFIEKLVPLAYDEGSVLFDVRESIDPQDQKSQVWAGASGKKLQPVFLRRDDNVNALFTAPERIVGCFCQVYDKADIEAHLELYMYKLKEEEKEEHFATLQKELLWSGDLDGTFDYDLERYRPLCRAAKIKALYKYQRPVYHDEPF